MGKTYCDKCRKIDKDCGAIIDFKVEMFCYKNLKKTLGSEWLKFEKLLKEQKGKFEKFSLCENCFLEFISLKSED